MNRKNGKKIQKPIPRRPSRQNKKHLYRSFQMGLIPLRPAALPLLGAKRGLRHKAPWPAAQTRA